MLVAGLCLLCSLGLTALCWKGVDSWGEFVQESRERREEIEQAEREAHMVDPFESPKDDPFARPSDDPYDDRWTYQDSLPSYVERNDVPRDDVRPYDPGKYGSGSVERNDDIQPDTDVLSPEVETVDAVASGVWFEGNFVGAMKNIWNDLEKVGTGDGSIGFGTNGYGREVVRTYSERLPLEEGLSCKFDILNRPGCEVFVRVAESGGVAVEARAWGSDYGPATVIVDARLYRAGELVAEGYVCPLPVGGPAWTFALFPLDEPADEIQFAFECTSELEECLGPNVAHTWNYDPETGMLSGELVNNEAVPLSVEWVDLAFLNRDGLPVYGMTCEVPERLWPGESVRYQFYTGLPGMVPDTERVEAYVRADPHGTDGEGRYLRS